LVVINRLVLIKNNMKTLHPLGIFILVLLFFGCQEKTPPLRLLALGDSYTIGESVSENERWPIQLASELSKKNIALAPPTIIAKTGWTTDELQEGINDAPLDYPYDWVSLLIGVNNQYRGGDIEKFKAEFENLLNQAVILVVIIKSTLLLFPSLTGELCRMQQTVIKKKLLLKLIISIKLFMKFVSTTTSAL
jgi:hypothetical protein